LGGGCAALTLAAPMLITVMAACVQQLTEQFTGVVDTAHMLTGSQCQLYRHYAADVIVAINQEGAHAG
jgi:hypothetical protein